MKIYKKNKIILGLIFTSILLAPVAVFAISRITNISNIFALTHSIPNGYTTFEDENLYNCVAINYKYYHPNTDISEGLTDAQLQQITSLSCGSNNIVNTKGIEKMTALTSLSLNDNQLTSLDVSNNTALTKLFLWNNQLTSLDVSHNTALTELYLWNNQLTSVNIPNSTTLTDLRLHDNQLTSVDVSHNTALTKLWLYNNHLTSIDVSHNTALIDLYLYNNQLTSIDVSNNTALTNLWLYNNQLTSINIPNSTTLTDLYLYNNQLTSIDVSHNTALTSLSLHHNQLTSIDVSHNTALEKLNLGGNQLTSIDVSHNTALIDLYLYENRLTSLDVSSNATLSNLETEENVLISTSVTAQENDNSYIYDFSNLKFIEDGERINHGKTTTPSNIVFSIQDTNYLTYDKLNMLLTITNLEATNGYVRVVGKEEDNNVPNRSYKIKLFDIEDDDTEEPIVYALSFNTNGGTGNISNLTCTTTDTNTFCTVTIPSTIPTLNGYTFQGWADTATATTAKYNPNDTITLTANKTIYAVWAKTDTGDDNTEEKPIDTEKSEENINVPNTGADTKNNGSAFSTIILLPGCITLFVVITHCIYTKRKIKHTINF